MVDVFDDVVVVASPINMVAADVAYDGDADDEHTHQHQHQHR